MHSPLGVSVHRECISSCFSLGVEEESHLPPASFPVFQILLHFTENATHYHSCRRRQQHPTQVLLPGKSHGWRSLVGCSPWGRCSRKRLSNFTFTFYFHPLEKEMATHSTILAWRIPVMGEPGGLPSMGSHRVGYD